MKKIASLLVVALVGLAAATATAKPEKGFHKGTYYLIGAGFGNVDEDTNVLTNRAFGGDILLAYGATLGWNFLDFLAAEFQMRYATETDNNQREHAAWIDFLAKYSVILDALTRWETVKLLPYVKAGAGVFGAAVPDTSAGNDRFGVFGPSAIFGGGLEVLIGELLYVGLDYNTHLVWLQEQRDGANRRILAGGFDPQYSLFGYLGVHF